MISRKSTRIAVVAAMATSFAANAALADECRDLTKGVKEMIDKFQPVEDKGNAMGCATTAEGLGLIKMFRIVIDECADEGDARHKALAELDRSVRFLQSSIDKNCG
jgi:N-acetylglutamate synthase-like GNAT family acetyltransferase